MCSAYTSNNKANIRPLKGDGIALSQLRENSRGIDA
jgi:hypothetical protein